MKKLEKLSLKQMKQGMPVIGRGEQNSYYGGYREEIEPANSSYNCHSYAWQDCQGWLSDPTDLISGGSYSEITGNIQPGDKVIYYGDLNNNNCYDCGEPIEHSAVVESAAGTLMLTSKWGAEGTYRHTIWDVPGQYSDVEYNGSLMSTKTAVLHN